MLDVTCWRCEQPGHGYADCQRPPARDRKELYLRIERYKERWIAGEIGTVQKRQFIAAENREFERTKAK